MSGTEKKQGYAFGTFKGVYTPSILTIFGVVMYLRFGWVLGNVGLPATLLIVTLATSITFLTGLSISAMATNMKVGTGGAYYIISRSLGLEAGVAIGIPLFFARAFGVAFYIAGFTEAVMSLTGLDPANPMTARLISCGTLLALTLLAYISADLALKVQFFIFFTIGASLVSLFMGTPSAEALTLPADTVVSAPLSFWAVFAIFFPAVTGIEAGLGLSGDLKNPAKSLPIGTLAAVITGYIVYMALPIFINAKVSNPELLRHNYNIMETISKWGWLVTAGVFAASLSSALGSLLGAPRMLQALASDRVIPRIIGRGYGKDKADPRIATAVSFGVAMLAILLGDLNAIAPILSMFFLLSYGLLNLSAGLEGLIESPSWRPKFKVHCAVSLMGSAACFLTMLMIDAGATILAIIVTVLIFYFIKRRGLNAHWNDMRYGILNLLVRYALHRMNKLEPDERTWRPNILALSGSPKSRWHLVELASSLTRHSSALTVASVLPVEDWSSEKVHSMEKSLQEYLAKREVDAMVRIFPSPDMLSGAYALIRAYGYGPLVPNTILIGDSANPDNFEEFSGLIQLIYKTRRNLILMRDSDLGDAPEANEIHVWWGGDSQNIGLILTLAYQTRLSPSWKKSNLVLKTIVESAGDQPLTKERLKNFIDEQRIPATVDVLLKGDQAIFDIIRKESAGANLIFMGMRPPGTEETVQEYSKYYENLLHSADNMPPLAFVLAAEPIEFHRLIGISDRD